MSWGWGLDWVDLAQDRGQVRGCYEMCNKSSGTTESGKFRE